MPYVDLAGLSRYASRQKDRLERDYALLRDMQWLRTEKAGAVACWPVGGTPLAPVVDYIFTETPPANGESKAPDNPSAITGVSSAKVTRCGKNLLSQNYYDQSGKETYDVTFTVNSDKSVSCSGTASNYAGFAFARNMFLPAGEYFLTGCPSGGSNSKYSLAIQRHGGSTASDYGDGVSLVVSNPDYYDIYASVKPGYNATGLVFNPPQLELGTTATSFEPYSGNDYIVQLGSTFYGGSIDLATGVMTVTWSSFTFNGSELWQSNETYLLQNTAGFYIGKADQRAIGFDCYSGEINPVACEVFSTVNSFTIDSQSIYKSLSSFMIRVDNSRLSSYGYTPGTSTSAEAVSAFKSWLSDNNVTVFYRRETPATVQLDPVSISALVQADKYTPRINTVYTDASSVQVGYVKSPIREEQELTQAIVAQGGNV